MANRCSVDGCNKNVHGHGFCMNHYIRFRKYGDPLGGGPFRMKRDGVCSVDGCTKPIIGIGLCNAHYLRFRKHGDPLGGGTSRGEPMEYLIKHMRDGCCYPWPYAKSAGRPSINHNGSSMPAYIVVCEMVNGPAPSRQHEVAHNCGKGDDGCFNADCLRWATRKENVADTLKHGTRNRGERQGSSKLTSSDVISIRRLVASGVAQTKVGEMYGVSGGHVSCICSGKSWAWLESETR